MRYLKKFNEAIEPDEIKDFCEMYLAYLLDDGYALTFNESGRVTQINFLKPRTDIEHIGIDWMNWDQIKDSFIPFLKMLDKQYDIKDNFIFFQIRGAAQVKMIFQDVIDDKVKEKIFSVTKGYENHDYEHATVISSVTIVLLDHSVGQYSWQLKESRNIFPYKNESREDELLEFTESHLAYLIDDGFEVMTYGADIESLGYGLCTKINISRRSGFTWEEIVDRFSPFIYMLNKEYYILEIVFHQIRGLQHQFDTNKEIEQLISGDTEYLSNKFFNQVRIVIKE